MQELKARPESFNEDMMVKLYRNSELANMTEQQQEIVNREFEEELRRSAELATSERKGELRGEQKTTSMIAKNMKNKGLDIKTLAECLGISQEEVKSILSGIDSDS